MKRVLTRAPLAFAVGLSLSLPALGQDNQDSTTNNDTAELGAVTVTGSRIARTDIEAAQPVISITAEDIEREGFTTVFEALSSQTVFTGTIQDDQFAGGFTQAANTLDLRSLGPGRTLILLNGRRATDYPLAFNGQSNVVNLATIPVAMVQRIEILSSGASAIYGSDAVAGVVNVILKDRVEEISTNLRIGDTDDGGGESIRFGAVGGFNPGDLSVTWGFEYFDRDPIWGFERDFQDSRNDDPTTSGLPLIQDGVNGVTNARMFLSLDPFDQNGDGLTYIDPGAAACSPLSNLERGSIEYSFRGGRGFYCGSAADVASQTIRNDRESYSLYTNLNYELDNGIGLFGTLIATTSETKFNVGSLFWQYDPNGPLGGGFFVNSAEPDVFGIGGRVDLWQRIFSQEEAGSSNIDNLGGGTNHFDEDLFDITLGARGTLGGRYDWEVSYSRSEYDLDRQRRLLLADVGDAFFLGQAEGTIDLFGDGNPFEIFDAPLDRLYRPLTVAEFNSISGIDTTTADTANETLQAVFSGDLGETWAGPISFAAVAEWGSQDYDINIDPGLVNGRFLFFTGTGGEGDRDRLALGGEFRIPLHDTLEASVAARYDKYDDITDVDDAFTYNVGLEYRPVDNLLVRGSFATSFRAPDMHFVFADASGFFSSPQDDYLTRRCQGEIPTAAPLAGEDPSDPDGPAIDPNNPAPTNCLEVYTVSGSRSGNPNLREEEGESFTLGVVWEPWDGFSMTLDYYNIELDDVVSDRSTTNLLELEADCRFGTGEDPNSQRCQDVFSRITRFAADSPDQTNRARVDTVATGPINQSFLETNGIDASLDYTLDTDAAGIFRFSLGYTHVLGSDFREFAGDALQNLRDDPDVSDFRSRARGSVGWDFRDFRTTVFFQRTGSIPTLDETTRCCEYVTYNLTSSYDITDQLRVGLSVQNLLDEKPPLDRTSNAYPYYSIFNFNPYGREAFVTLDYRFN
ncbi:MAG: TonB-dependent receptor [Pseudomonadota bacterium]